MVAFFAAGSGSIVNLIFLLTIGLELLYLGLVPRSARFQKYINLKKFQERNSKFDDKKLFSSLTEQSQKKFLILKHITKLIKKNFSSIPYTSHGMLEHIHTRLDSLLTSYMMLLDSTNRYEQYLNTSLAKKLNSEIQQARREYEEAGSTRLKDVLERRISILEKRLSKYDIAQEKFAISQSQEKTIEDTIRYIYEKSLTMNNMDDLDQQLDALMLDLDDTELLYSDIHFNNDAITDLKKSLVEIENLAEASEPDISVKNKEKV